MTLFRPASALMVQYAHDHRDRHNMATHVVGLGRGDGCDQLSIMLSLRL
jgi:hypothetical protein